MFAARLADATALRTPLFFFSFCALAVASALPAAHADQTLNSNEKSKPGIQAPPGDGKTDPNFVPIGGGSTDIGAGGGFFAGLTRQKRGYVPYRWDIQSAMFAAARIENGGPLLSYLDAYVKATVPRLGEAPLQLELRPSVTRETTLDYYGMGNASTAQATPGSGLTTYRYGRTRTDLSLNLRFRLLDHFSGIVGVDEAVRWLQVPTGSKLAADAKSDDPEVRSLVGPTGTAGIAQFVYSLAVDTRDDEVTPSSGTFDELWVRLSPGGNDTLPFRYGEATASLRGYVPVVPKRLTLALRLVGDVLVGDAPFDVLASANGEYALGGSTGVRGVPAQRYYGKVKVFGNVEARVRIVDMHLFDKPISLGVAAFFDGGRLWTDTAPHPELDGRGLGLKYGCGGGLRVVSGSAFVLRADVAWSPDANPVGGYVAAGEAF